MSKNGIVQINYINIYISDVRIYIHILPNSACNTRKCPFSIALIECDKTEREIPPLLLLVFSDKESARDQTINKKCQFFNEQNTNEKKCNHRNTCVFKMAFVMVRYQPTHSLLNSLKFCSTQERR